MKRSENLPRAAAALALALAAALCPMAKAVFVPVSVPDDAPPVAENLEVTTFRGVSVSGSFRAVDPEGGDVSYSVLTEPKKGTVAVNGGGFVYTPSADGRGRDSFAYAAADAAGNVSGRAEVTINIKKQSTDVTYSDMTGDGCQYAATLLAEKGVFTGEKVGSRWLFHPGEPVSRGEFLAMCMELGGARLLDGIKRTGFSDDGGIPSWQKPYAATALMSGLITGAKNDAGLTVFDPDGGITFAEATVMVDGILDVTDVSAPEDAPACPAWAAQAEANLASCGVGVPDSGGAMTRADAAVMLSGASAILDARGGPKILGFIK